MDLMVVYIILTWLACLGWSIFALAISGSDLAGLIIAGGIIGPLVIMFYMRAYIYYSLNDFEFFEDVKLVNKEIDKHNKDITEMEQSKERI